MTDVTSGFVLTDDDVSIAYDLYGAKKRDLVIIAHGFFNSKEALLLKGLAGELSLRYDVLMFDFRGHGKSGGVFCWTSKEYLDVLAVLKWARERYSKIALIGFSLGAAASLIAASKFPPVDTVIAVSAPSSFWKIDYHFWQLNAGVDILYNLFGEGRVGKTVRPGPFWLKKERPIDLVSTLASSLFFIHGAKDWIIKPWHSRRLYEKARSPKGLALINGGLHAEYLFLKHQSVVIPMIENWLSRELD